MTSQTKTRAGAATPSAGNFQLSQNNCPASRADIEAEQRDIIETPVAAQLEYRMALAGDALGDAARISPSMDCSPKARRDAATKSELSNGSKPSRRPSMRRGTSTA